MARSVPATAALIVSLCWLALIAFWLLSASSSKKAARTTSWWAGPGVRVVIVIALLYLARLGGFQHLRFDVARGTPHPGALAAVIGAIVCAAGVAVAIWARVHIGRNWGMPMSLREGHELVTSGPYASIRHPIYSGILLTMIGSALAVGPQWLLPFVVSLVYFVYAARREEQDMTQQFPDVYPAYQQRTKMLIPYLL